MESNEALRQELLLEVESVAPVLAEHAPQSEALGRLDEPTVEALAKTRLIRFACPRDLGGEEADPLTQIEVLEALARVDGSAGWCLGISAVSSALVGAYLPARSSKQIFANGDVPMAGVITPRGQAEPVDGGYRVSGRWAFGSAIHHADYVMVGALIPGQAPPEGICLVVLPRDQVVVHDNWQVAGLRGTGSCDYSIENVFVPAEMSARLLDMMLGDAVTGGPALRLGIPGLLVPFHIGVALGIGRRALDEATEQAIDKGRGFPPSALPTHPHVQFALGKAELELESARALAVEIVSGLYAEARAGRVPAPSQQAKARAAASYITEVAQRVTTGAFQALGGGALFDANPLQRCFRDIYAAGQHFVVSQSSYRALGQFNLELPDANPML